jgi:hypothetical protein
MEMDGSEPLPHGGHHDGVLGSGLGAGALVAVVALSTAVFLLWGGPLWSAPTGASHVARIAISYLLVAPTVAIALATLGRWSMTRLVTAVALCWGAKLVVTASLYSLLAPGAGHDYAPEAVPIAPRRAPAAAPSGYESAAGQVPSADLVGVVSKGGRPVAGAIVVVDAPRPGRPLGEPREVRIALGDLAGATMVATTRDRLFAASRDRELHTVRLFLDDQQIASMALPPDGAPLQLSAPEPGIYGWSCAVHPGERGTLVLVDHPYTATTTDDGKFQLSATPLGSATLIVVRHDLGVFRHAVTVAGRGASLTIDIGETHPIEP